MMNVLALRCHHTSAKRVNEALFKKPMESKFKALAKKYSCPENYNLLTVQRTSPGIWNDLPRASRELDVGCEISHRVFAFSGPLLRLCLAFFLEVS